MRSLDMADERRANRVSDSELERAIIGRLSERRVGVRSLKVKSNQGVVTVHGVAFSFYERQLCAHLSRTVPGVVALVDAVDVRPVEEPSSSRGFASDAVA
jgi:osmotically-inducible protein OsmY